MRWPPWRVERAVHEPAKVLLDLAIAVALGGDCAADIAVVRAQPALFGEVVSDPTVSRLIATLAADVEAAIAAISAARAEARERVWRRQRPVRGGADSQVIIDLHATLVTTHSEKQFAKPTFKYGFGFHPLLAFCDHGVEGSGETLAAMLRPGSATANIAADLIAVLDAALAQLPEHERARVLVACRHRRWGQGVPPSHHRPRPALQRRVLRDTTGTRGAGQCPAPTLAGRDRWRWLAREGP